MQKQIFKRVSVWLPEISYPKLEHYRGTFQNRWYWFRSFLTQDGEVRNWPLIFSSSPENVNHSASFFALVYLLHRHVHGYVWRSNRLATEKHEPRKEKYVRIDSWISTRFKNARVSLASVFMPSSSETHIETQEQRSTFVTYVFPLSVLFFGLLRFLSLLYFFFCCLSLFCILLLHVLYFFPSSPFSRRCFPSFLFSCFVFFRVFFCYVFSSSLSPFLYYCFFLLFPQQPIRVFSSDFFCFFFLLCPITLVYFLLFSL